MASYDGGSHSQWVPSFWIVVIRPVWFLSWVGWQRNSCPLLSEESGGAQTQIPKCTRTGLANLVVTLLFAGWRLLCPGIVSVSETPQHPRRPKAEHCLFCSLPWCWYFPKQIQELKWEKEDGFLCGYQIIRLLWGLDKNKSSVPIISYCGDWVIFCKMVTSQDWRNDSVVRVNTITPLAENMSFS